jgi:uncharacterized protein
MSTPAPTPRVRVRRGAQRAVYDRHSIYEILDAGMVCHLGYVVDGQPYVIPTLYGRDGDRLVLHGSSASRALCSGSTTPVCVTVTHLDGLVLARSLFNHSANYRSAIVLGQPVVITEASEKLHALRVLTDHVLPRRWNEARPPNDKELSATLLLQLDLTECSAKVRTGPPDDKGEDLGLDVWAGEIPLELTAHLPKAAPDLAPGVDTPSSVLGWTPGLDRHGRG